MDGFLKRRLSLSYILVNSVIHLCYVLFCSLSVLYSYAASLTQLCLAHIQVISYLLLLIEGNSSSSTVTSLSGIMSATKVIKELECLSHEERLRLFVLEYRKFSKILSVCRCMMGGVKIELNSSQEIPMTGGEAVGTS